MKVISLITDFGLKDNFVGVMKGGKRIKKDYLL